MLLRGVNHADHGATAIARVNGMVSEKIVVVRVGAWLTCREVLRHNGIISPGFRQNYVFAMGFPMQLRSFVRIVEI